MTIQFHCPNCDSVIRVPDQAAGRRGTCPACQTKLLVPTVPAAAPDQPASAVPTPIIPVAPSADTEASIARQLKARKKRGQGAILIPLTFLAVMAGVGLYFYWINRPTLDGPLPGVVLADFSPPQRGLEFEAANVDPTIMADIAQKLKDDPIRISSPIMHLSLVGTGRSVQVRIQDGVDVDFFAVRIDADPDLRNFYIQHGRELEKDRLRELKAGIGDFVKDWQESGAEPMTVQRLMEYRDRIGINTLVNGMGYHLVAIAGEHIYPCVYEDLDGILYFLLPPRTRQFKMEGRKLPDGRQLVPADYTVTVKQPSATDTASP